MIEQGIPCPPNSTSPQYKAVRLVVQQHGPQQKAQRANAALGLAPLTFQPLDPDMQKVLVALKTKSNINGVLVALKTKSNIKNPIYMYTYINVYIYLYIYI